MPKPPRKPATVLVIDPLEETRDVLSTVLARRGFTIVTARRADEGLRLARHHNPDVIVLDHDAPAAGEPAERAAARAAIDDDARQRQAPVLHLTNDDDTAANVLALRKPYHYRPLIHKIEELLAHRRAG